MHSLWRWQLQCWTWQTLWQTPVQYSTVDWASSWYGQHYIAPYRRHTRVKPSKQDQRVMNQSLTVEVCQHAEVHRYMCAGCCCLHIQESGGDLHLYALNRLALHSGLDESWTFSQCSYCREHCVNQECCVWGQMSDHLVSLEFNEFQHCVGRCLCIHTRTRMHARVRSIECQ